MKRRVIPIPWSFEQGRRKRPHLIEYHNYPSELALDLWDYVISVGTSRCPPGHDTFSHAYRNAYLLHYVVKGELEHIVEGKIHRVREGGLCLLDYSKRFRLRNKQPRAVHLWYILFNGKEMPRVFRELGADTRPLFERVPSRRFESLFRRIWDLSARKPHAHEVKTHVALNAMLAELFVERLELSVGTSLVGKNVVLSEKVRLAINFINYMHPHNIGLKHIESAIGLNMHHLSRKFHEEVGMAPIHYLNLYRIERAKHFLATSDKPVTEIARLVGIPDPNYFARMFRKLTGKTPQAYRGENAESPVRTA